MINVEGRQKLIDALREWVGHYDQTTFGTHRSYCVAKDNECGTMMCMAGMALLLEIGWKRYLARVKKVDGLYASPVETKFHTDCLEAGKKLLGLPKGEHKEYSAHNRRMPMIFGGESEWPAKFRNKYEKAATQRGRVSAAIAALMAMDEFGRLPKSKKDEDDD